MRVVTDDELKRINRDFLGAKGKRLPFIATYRTYVVVFSIAFATFVAFWVLRVPFSEWTALLYCVVVAYASLLVVRRLQGDVGIVAMFKAAGQEVVVPRSSSPHPRTYRVAAKVPHYSLDAEPRRRWWQRRSRKETR